MKVKLFTHTDLDGIGCAILGKLAFKEINIDYCDYDDLYISIDNFIQNKEYENYDEIFITDLSINDELAHLIESSKIKEKLKVFDHHPISLKQNIYPWSYSKTEEIIDYEPCRTQKTCGTALFYRYLNTEKLLNKYRSFSLYLFVRTILFYDTWLWKNDEENEIMSKQLNDLFYIYGQDMFMEIFINRLKNLQFEFSIGDLKILELEQEKIKRYIKEKNENLKTIKVLNYSAGVVFAEQYISELGNELSTLNPDLDFIIIINMDKAISYRTNKTNIDLGLDVASKFGGGGHPQAAGSQIDNTVKEKLLELIFN